VRVRPFILPLLVVLSLASATDSTARSTGSRSRTRLVESVEIEGLPSSISASSLKGGLALAQRSGFLGIFGRPPLETGTLDDDLHRIRLFLARHGYPDAQVTSTIEEHSNDDRVTVVFHVVPGAPVVLHSIAIDDLPPPLLEKGYRDHGFCRLHEPLDDESVERERVAILMDLRDAGYAKASVSTRLDIDGERQAELHFLVTAGPRFQVGSLRLTGPSSDLVPMLRRVVRIPAGTWYSTGLVEDIDWQLRQLNLFRRIQLGLVEADSSTLDFHYELMESDHRTVELGVGYFTDDKFRITAAWQHRNLFKAGRGFKISGLYSAIESHLTASIWWPAIFSTPNTAVLSLSYRVEDERSYHQTENRVSLFSSYRPNRRVSLNYGLSSSHIDLDDKTLQGDVSGDTQGWIFRLFADWTRDRRDDWLDARRGRMITVHGDLTPPGGTSIDHLARLAVELSSTHTLSGELRLAVKALVGGAVPLYGDDEILISQRLFCGGARSMRGYRRRELGPRDSAGHPLGGEAKYEASAELRFPIWRSLEGAAFLDSAQLWRHWDQVFTGGVEWAVGPGLAVNTPVGPLRIDYGIRLNSRNDGRSNGVFHFSVGHPY